MCKIIGVHGCKSLVADYLDEGRLCLVHEQEVQAKQSKAFLLEG
jgi:hypothetical protein